MYVQLFTIRIASPHFLEDQQKLNDFLQQVKFVKSATHFVETTEQQHWSVLLHYENKPQAKENLVTVEEADLTPGSLYVLECLKQWRTDKAAALSIPKFMICHNSELINIAFHHPKNKEALGNIKGFGAKKIEKYGDEIIAVLNVV
jgi:superfamily II DNA helicase RecQ